MLLALIRMKLTVNFYKDNLTGKKTIMGVPKAMTPAAEVLYTSSIYFFNRLIHPLCWEVGVSQPPSPQRLRSLQ